MLYHAVIRSFLSLSKKLCNIKVHFLCMMLLYTQVVEFCRRHGYVSSGFAAGAVVGITF